MTKSQIESILQDYFSPTTYTAHVTMTGNLSHILLTYLDYKPEPTVLTELSSLIPLSRIEITEREFSHSTLYQELQSILDESPDIQIKTDTNTIRIVPLSVYLEERLFLKSL